MPIEKWECDECGVIIPNSAILVIFVGHPKRGHGKVSVSQCPECGEVNCFTALCDEPGCTREVTCGWPTKSGGYRNTCGDHMRSNEDQVAKQGGSP